MGGRAAPHAPFDLSLPSKVETVGRRQGQGRMTVWSGAEVHVGLYLYPRALLSATSGLGVSAEMRRLPRLLAAPPGAA